MRLLASLRARLIAMVVTLLAVTLGAVAVVSLRVAHVEIRKLNVEIRTGPPPSTVALRDHHALRGSWTGVVPLLERLSRQSEEDVLLFDQAGRFIAASDPGFASARIQLRPDRSIRMERNSGGNNVVGILFGHPLEIHAADGTAIGTLFLLPRHGALEGPPGGRSIDRAFFWIFLVAMVAAILMAVAMARWISVPVERITAAARRMEGGDLAVRVAPGGGAQLEELARSFNAMAASIDRNEEVRRRMVSDVAHELRAPLTNIRCELESIQDGLTNATPDRIAALHAETMQLAALIDDLQDLSLADAGRLDLVLRSEDVQAVVLRAVTAMDARARERNVEIVAQGEPGVMCLADARRLLQILTNLLANAIAHSDAGSRVLATWEKVAPDVVVRVIDSGSGIAHEELDRIFERFYRSDPSRSRATGGAGLGLAIVRQLILAHGGQVWVESTPDRGSTFSFTVPLAS